MMTLNRQNFKVLALPCFRLVSRGLFVAATLISNGFVSSSCSVELVSIGACNYTFLKKFTWLCLNGGSEPVWLSRGGPRPVDSVGSPFS